MSFEYTSTVIVKWNLDEFMKIIDEFEDKLSYKVHHKTFSGNSYQMVLLHIAGKSIVTTREVLTLCANGYPDGALSLARNLYEQMMIVTFFESYQNVEEFQDYIDDYCLNYEVQRNKSLRSISKYIPEDNYGELAEEYTNIKKRAKHKIAGDYWWANCTNFSELISKIMRKQEDKEFYQFLGFHYARYKRACVSLHANCMGNSMRLGSTSGFNVIDTSPTEYGHSSPLMFAVVSLIYIIGCICNCFQIDATEILKSLNKLAVYYQSNEQEDKR